MSVGAVLIGLAALILVAAYVLEPFREGASTIDEQIEAWVAEVREHKVPVVAEGVGDAQSEGSGERSTPVQTTGRYCHQCGQPVKPDHRFCPNCGTSLLDA